MQGDPQVLIQLNLLLTGELSSADQYFIHSQMYENWGYTRLFTRIAHEREEELEHASLLIHRILFLGGIPDVNVRDSIKVGKDVPEMLKNDLESELHVIAELKKSIAFCESKSDFETRRILVELLKNTEEDHARWLEIQLKLIDQIGLQNYLQSAAGKVEGSNEGK